MFGIHHNNSDRKRLNVLVRLVSYLLVQYTLLFLLIIFKPAKCLNVLHQLHVFSSITNKMQHYTIYLFRISVKFSTCFRRFLRPSSGAQNSIYSNGYFVKTLLLPTSVVEEVEPSLTKYPILYIQFWAPDDGRRNRLKHVEHFTEINKLCNVASCWLYLEKLLRCADPWTSNVILSFPH